MRYPKTRLEWCTVCGERYTLRRAERFAYMKGYRYRPDPHDCPRECQFCGEAYIYVANSASARPAHSCPGVEADRAKAREVMQKMNAAMSRVLGGRQR